MMKHSVLIILSCILLMFSYATVAPFEFSSIDHEQRAYQLFTTIRYPACQNQNLLDSDSAHAAALMLEISLRIESGETNEQILTELKQRYGDLINYDPPFNPGTFFLWFMPIIVLFFMGLFSAFRYVPIEKEEDE